jgi:hypothetical protein
MTARVILLTCALALIPATGQAATGETGWQGTSWGETSSALAAQFGRQATQLDRPLDFGDAHVDVVLKNYPIGGYPFIVYFQMGNDGHGLKRIQIERARHGAVPEVSAAAFKELAALYGPPTESCAAPARNVGDQTLIEHIWRRDGSVVRALFREMSLNNLDPYLARANGDFEFFGAQAAGLPQQLLIRIAPAGTEPDDCRPKRKP